MEIKVKVQVKGGALIRNKEGRPKFDSPDKIRNHVKSLTDEDKRYLVEYYGVDRFEDFLDG